MILSLELQSEPRYRLIQSKLPQVTSRSVTDTPQFQQFAVPVLLDISDLAGKLSSDTTLWDVSRLGDEKGRDIYVLPAKVDTADANISDDIFDIFDIFNGYSHLTRSGYNNGFNAGHKETKK